MIPLAVFSHVVATVEGATDVTQALHQWNQVATKTLLYAPGATSARFAIGCRMSGAGSVSNAVDGAIDEVAVYNKVLPAAAVRAHFDAR